MKTYSENDQLMREMGSTKGFDPMPPDQYLIFLHKRYPTVLRVWACVASLTIRQGRRSPFCVDENGKEVHLLHIARLLKIDRSQAGRALAELEGLGQVRTDARRICFCGDVPTLQEVEAKIRRNGDLYKLFDPANSNKINKWEPEVRNRFFAEEKTESEAERQFIAEVVAEGRAIFADRKDTRWKAYGLSVKRLPKRRVKASPLRPVLTQYVQGAFSFEKTPSVQTENASVQSEETGENGICTLTFPRASLYTETETEIRGTHTRVLSTDLERRGVHSPDFERFVGGFLSAGKLLNDQDVGKASVLWNALSIEDRLGAIADVEPKFTDGTWSDALHTPMPINYLRSEAWKRKGPGRILPAPPKNHREVQMQLAEERFLKGAKV